jgi:LytS/YehU family sensor histidine kinase
VEVRAEEGPTGLVVEVRNTGSLSAPGPATSSVGIANVKARLAAMGHPKDAFVLSEQDGWVSARLTLG